MTNDRKRTILMAAMAVCALAVPAFAQWPGGIDFGNGGGPVPEIEDRRNRTTVSIRTVPFGELCVRAVEAVGYDPRLNQRLYRVGFDSGPMTGLGVTAYENAFSSARTQDDAVRALSAARADARSFARGRGQC
jgi:hypothetical protein